MYVRSTCSLALSSSGNLLDVSAKDLSKRGCKTSSRSSTLSSSRSTSGIKSATSIMHLLCGERCDRKNALCHELFFFPGGFCPQAVRGSLAEVAEGNQLTSVVKALLQVNREHTTSVNIALLRLQLKARTNHVFYSSSHAILLLSSPGESHWLLIMRA